MNKYIKISIAAVGGVFLLLLLTTAVILLNKFNIQITLKGEQNITLEYGEKYNEQGADAKLVGKFIYKNGKPVKVEKNGKVNDQKLGKYEVTYSAKSSRYSATKVRTVTVVDTQVPSLVLDGSDKVSLTKGSKYTEPGFSATDNYDGDITSLVTVDGEVDVNKAGEYTLTYTVSDSSGNTSTLTRKVTVKAPVVRPSVNTGNINTIPAGPKTVYLTFDDGAGPYTSYLLDVLAKYGVKATFFVKNSGYNHLISRMASEGHAVGLHSATHDYKKIYQSEDAFYSDLDVIQNVVVAQTGKRSNLIRFPGGSSNMVSKFNPGIMSRLAVSVTNNGYRYFDWNVDSNDAGGATTTEQVVNNVINGISKRSVSVVLQHDIKKFSVNAVEQIITWGLNNGYTFKALDETSPVCHHGINN